MKTTVSLPRQKPHVLAITVFVVGAIALIGLLAKGLLLDPTRVPPAIIGLQAKDFRVATVQGDAVLPSPGTGSFSLKDLRGKPVVLNFWASWCVSCREEARELEAFWKDHRDQVLVVGIAIQDQKAAASQFAKAFGKTYLIGLDEDGKAAIDYGVSGVPETFLIDRNGIIRHKEIGPVDAKGLHKLLAKIL